MFIKFAIVVCKLFQFGPVQNIVVWEKVNCGKGLEVYKTVTSFNNP